MGVLLESIPELRLSARHRLKYDNDYCGFQVLISACQQFMVSKRRLPIPGQHSFARADSKKSVKRCLPIS
ncbi:MAG: hypothetical protein ACRECH_11325 [Nitrososphaerales archaeon]